MLAEHAAHGVSDFAEGRALLDGRDDWRHEVRRPARSRFHRVQRCAPFAIAASCADGPHALDLAAFDFGVYAKQIRARIDVPACRSIPVYIPVDSNDDGIARIDRLLRAIGGVLDLLLDVARFDRREGSAERSDRGDPRPRARFAMSSPRSRRSRRQGRPCSPHRSHAG